MFAQTATWTGGNSFLSYGTAGNWNPAVVPTNGAGANYTVIVPDNASLTYDLPNNAVIDALSFGAGSAFRLTNQRSLLVTGPALVKGQIEAGGAGSAFRAPTNTTVLSSNPRLYATGGGQIQVGASTYSWDRYNASATLLSAYGAGSAIDLKAVSSMLVSYGDNNAWTYWINARTNGLIDLSSLSQLTGPGQDDYLEFNVDTGGNIKFDALNRITGNTRFNIGISLLQFPSLANASGAHFNIASNSTVRMPLLSSFDSANFTLGQNATVEAQNLVSLDGVFLNLTNGSSFLATNLSVYRNSDIPVLPGRNFQPGLLADIYASRIAVSGGATFRVGALSYDMPTDWRWSPTLFSADGAGSLLNMSAIKTFTAHWGHNNSWTYSVTANNSGVIDFSGLETILGGEQDDWLVFNVQNGGDIKFDSLRQVTRQTRFNVQTLRLDMPSLDYAEGTTFNLADGARLNMTNATRLTSCAFNFGFNSTLNAPKLGTLQDTTLALSPGVIVNAPPFTNINSGRFSVSGGSVLHLAAPAYDTPGDWRWSPAIFSADGSGSLLDLAAMRNLVVQGGWGGAWSYGVTANNNGIIDLSGLETVRGARTDTYDNDDWLSFTLSNGGEIRLNALRQITGRTRFNVNIPFYQLPALETAEYTAFNLADNGRMTLPALRDMNYCSATLGLNSGITFPAATNFANGAFTLGVNSSLQAPNLYNWYNSSVSLGLNSTCNVPNLLSFVTSDLTLSPGRTFIAPAFTNIYASRLAVSGGSTLRVAAADYDIWPDWRTSVQLFSADGTGSLLDLASIRNLRARWGHNNAWDYSITANNNGVVDLSGLVNAIGAEQDDWLVFNVQNGGELRLNSLTNVTQRTRFNLQVPDYSLPALRTVDSTAFILVDSTRLRMTNLVSLDNCAFTFGFNNTLDAPQLRTFRNTTLAVVPGRIINAPPFTNIYGSLFSVSGGSVLHLGATSFEHANDWRTSATLLSADGNGSLIEAASLKTVTSYGGWSGAWTYWVTAINGGTVDLSGLDSVTGPRTDTFDNDDWLRFNADTGGTVKLGNASVTRRVQFTATGTSSRMELNGLTLRPPATLNVGSRATLDLKGSFTFENTDPNTIVVEGSPLQMDGTQPQVLEVGGKNLGPTGASSRNFGYSQLIIGSSNQSSFVRLQDALNNGQRGPSGESEALYLYGLDGQGLRLLNGSRLIVGTVPVYAFLGGQMRPLNMLFTGATNSLAYDSGVLALSGGPRITNMTPGLTVNPPVSSVDVTFDMAIAPASFTTADVAITGPSGSIATTSVTPVSGNTYRISFAAQTANGTYTVRVGPAVNELAGNIAGMDQDGDGLAGEVTDAFTGSFNLDGIPPVILSALALQNGTRVGITFDEPVSAVFATNPANYLVNGLAPTAALLQTNSYQVALAVGALVGETFTLNINNLADPYGNSANRSFTGTILALEPRDIGGPGSDPRETGSTVTFTGTDFDSIGGGSMIWTSSDAFHFVFERRTGDFDVRVQLTRLDRTGSWADGGLMVRESLAGTSRKIQAIVEIPQNSGTYYPGIRYTTGANVATPYPYISGVDPNNAGIPNAWIRLRRTGNVFSMFRGTNGTDWIEFGRVTNDFPAVSYLGLATCAYNNTAGQAITAWFRNYSDITPTIVTQPQSQSVASSATVTFAVTARGLLPLSYQWYYNGVAVNGVTNFFTRTGVTTNVVGDYRVVVTNPYGSVTSQVAVLVVDGVGAGGFEADVSPTPYGNNSVSVSDWVRVGRLVAGLESTLSSSDFQRTDCAPRTNAVLGTLPLGDGRLTVADWTQAGRYAAALDSLTPAGGPNAPVAGGAGMRSTTSLIKSWDGVEAVPAVTLRSTKAALGQSFPILLTLSGGGAVNAAGFSVRFDATRLRYLRTELANPVPGAVLQVNTNAAASGTVGFIVASPAMESFLAGDTALLELHFLALAGTGATPVAFDDLPVLREVVDVEATPFGQVAYHDAAVTLVKAPRLTSLRVGAAATRFTLSGEPGETYQVFTSRDLVNWIPLQRIVIGTDPVVVEDTVVGAPQRFYRAIPQP